MKKKIVLLYCFLLMIIAGPFVPETTAQVIIPDVCGECTSDLDCPDGTSCNAADICLISCKCPQCDVCAGHCIPVSTERCTTNADCSDRTEFCAKIPGDCNGIGKCKIRPEGCPEIYSPVCGCDRNTYGNACEAAAAGVNIAHEGECKIGKECKTNDTCLDETEYCAKVPGNCDGEGVCKERPTICPLFFDPVCGCDGNTYNNDCDAAAAGVNIAHRGQCKVIKECLGNEDCLDISEFCLKKPGNCDGIGMCKIRPEACPEIFAPVCGCDGNTYSNACFSAMAGISVDFPGSCECVPTTDRERGRMCKDRIDNDCDGFIDRDDPDCRGRGEGKL